MPLNAVVLLTMLTLATILDLKWSKIPNWLTFSCFTIGVCLQILEANGITDIVKLAGSFALPLLIFLVFYLKGGMAAGDVKLMAAAGVLLGWPAALLATGFSLVAGTVLAILYMIARGGFPELCQRYIAPLKAIFFIKADTHKVTGSSELAKSRFPYALAIAIGSSLALFVSQ